MTRRRFVLKSAAFIGLLMVILVVPGYAEDSEVARQTLKGIMGVHVIVEELQPNILKYEKFTKNFALNKAQIRTDVEKRLKDAGIIVLPWNEWEKTTGCPIIYVNINTHEREKYWFAYNVDVELRQVVYLVANPEIKTLTATWAMNITGEANIGNLQLVRNDVGVLVGKFVGAWTAVNKR